MAFLACDEFRALLADEISGVETSERELRSHLAACAACAGHAQELLWQDRVLAELAARARLEPLMARVRESILSTRPVAFAEPARRAVRPRWGRAAVAAALVLAALTALLVLRPSGGGQVVVRPAPEPRPVRNDSARTTAKPEETPAPVVAKEDVNSAPTASPEPAKREVVKVVTPKKDVATAKPAPAPEAVPGPVKGPAARADTVEPKSVPDVVLPARRTTDEAVRVGMAFLQKKIGSIEAMRMHRELSYDELLLWTYLHGGAVEADVQRILRRMLERKLERTYAVSLQAMALEKLDPVAYQGRIQQCAQFLVDNQCKNGQWGYGDPSVFAEDVPTPPNPKAPKVPRKVIVKKMRPGPESGDHSNSMYAALGLRACHDAGIMLPPEVLQLAQKAWRDSQIKPEGGWCYGKHDGHKAYGSMTAGGVGSLVIYDHILGQDRKRDREVQAGLGWLEKRFSVAFNPGLNEHAGREENTTHHYFYYLYALERAAILYDTAVIGKHDWYQKGSEALVGCQRLDGAWLSKEGGNEVSDTCFAILFLRKAARALPDVSTGPKR